MEVNLRGLLFTRDKDPSHLTSPHLISLDMVVLPKIDELKGRVVFPDGEDEKKYFVFVMKYWEYETKELLAKRLNPLRPLQVFKIRKRRNLLKKRAFS